MVDTRIETFWGETPGQAWEPFVAWMRSREREIEILNKPRIEIKLIQTLTPPHEQVPDVYFVTVQYKERQAL
jgi:hypothetical protein